MTPKQFRRKLEKIQKRFEEIEETLNELPIGLQVEINDFHNDDATLQYCTRWGLSGISELIEAYDEVHEKTSENYEI